MTMTRTGPRLARSLARRGRAGHPAFSSRLMTSK